MNAIAECTFLQLVLLVRIPVVIENESTHAQRLTSTSASGEYGVGLLPPGSYSAIATANRFANALAATVTVVVSETSTIDFHLVIAASAQVRLPLLGIIAVAVGITSGFPILFRQTRKGAMGSTFQILKFRTMQRTPGDCASAIAAQSAHRITMLGVFLRRTKLDELPQVWNVLRGEMSLVGPRPKVPEQQSGPLPCPPGTTGAAALAFACEENMLQELAPELVTSFFYQKILPIKLRLDAAYMSQASLGSDLRIIVDAVLGRWRLYALDLELPASRKRPGEIAEEVSMLSWWEAPAANLRL